MATATGSLPQLTNDEIKRYSRHLIMPEVGVDGQRRLKAGKVLCIGAGGLGSPAAMYLAAAGVGTLGLVDFDVVDFSNLQRQLLHGTGDVGRSKIASATDRLHAINKRGVFLVTRACLPLMLRTGRGSVMPGRQALCSMWCTNSLRKCLRKLFTGIAAASPRAQMVRPAMLSATFFKVAGSFSVPPPATMRSVILRIHCAPSRHGVHWPQLSCL